MMKNTISFIPGFCDSDCTFKPTTNQLSKKIIEKVKYQSPEVRARLNNLIQEQKEYKLEEASQNITPL